MCGALVDDVGVNCGAVHTWRHTPPTDLAVPRPRIAVRFPLDGLGNYRSTAISVWTYGHETCCMDMPAVARPFSPLRRFSCHGYEVTLPGVRERGEATGDHPVWA
jgi:hypothetical protein